MYILKTIILVFLTNLILAQDFDKKCKVIYDNYRVKDSLLKVSIQINDSLSICNKQFSFEINKLQTQIVAIESESKYIKIGSQNWADLNLQVTQLNDGTEIVFANTKEKWEECFQKKIPAYCIHPNDSSNSFGFLYNVYALKSNKLAPAGWRIPTKKDAELLIANLNAISPTGARLIKATLSGNQANWSVPGLDIFHFGLRPNGFRLSGGNEWYYGNKIYFWCLPTDDVKVSVFAVTEYNDLPFFLDKELGQENYGLYVRCIK
jgi:uncharacterized protein (TIGR02145 family)